MKVEVAGTNVEVSVLSNLLKMLPQKVRIKYKDKLTPEVISSAYARISRSKKSVNELIKESIASPQNARRSITNILGMGHQSIADHVMFNFNITGVSRLLVESIEERRLAGYTEKSQRYVILDGDYIKPCEFLASDITKFKNLVKVQNAFYRKNNRKLLKNLVRQLGTGYNISIENKAKEDARYSLCLATETQLGCSYTGQTIELAIRKNKYGELEEQRKFAKLLFNAVYKIAPSLIQLSDSKLFKLYNKGQSLKDDNFKHTECSLKKIVNQIYGDDADVKKGLKNCKSGGVKIGVCTEKVVSLVEHNNPDRQIIISLLHKNSIRSISECEKTADKLIKSGRARDFIADVLKYISEFDKVPREFETGFLIYELPVSASCFAQLKRHRMVTILSQNYDPSIGYAIPPEVKNIGAGKELGEICDKSTDLYYKFLSKYGKAAEYCLTNAHMRRVILATNVRELYHISRTREDSSAQWEIRDLACKMSEMAKQVAPVTTILLGGKHEFVKCKAHEEAHSS